MGNGEELANLKSRCPVECGVKASKGWTTIAELLNMMPMLITAALLPDDHGGGSDGARSVPS